MAEQISFKERVRLAAIHNASLYDSYYVQKSYLLISDAFKIRPYYIVEAEPDNYLHLVGVSTALSANDFYRKCLDGTLQDADFDIAFHGRDEKASKGSIRQKIVTLPYMFSLFSGSNEIEESFKKNVVRCSIASSNNLCTLGLIATPHARPMTLLRGNELDSSKSGRIKIILSKKRSDDTFADIRTGSISELAVHYDSIKDLLQKDLIDRVTAYLSPDKDSSSQNGVITFDRQTHNTSETD